jgi:succinate dehydrogenase / fumarate reductase, cytochrome b subunit
MKINRPLSPHLTIYTPQLTSTLSILHRITGAFLASLLLFTLLGLKLCDLSVSFYPFYWCIFYVIASFHWFVFGLTNLAFLAVCYHMSNGIRHIIWDLGFCLDLSKVYTSGIVMLFCAVMLALLNWLRLFVI